MKKIRSHLIYDTETIEHLIYDTETATKIAEVDNNYSRSDFHFCMEILHRTLQGRYFIYGEGGALSAYSQPVGNDGYTGGSDIVPLSENEAMDWLERHDEVDTLQDLFADQLTEA